MKYPELSTHWTGARLEEQETRSGRCRAAIKVRKWAGWLGVNWFGGDGAEA